MATEDPEDMAHSLKDLKKMGKQRKKEIKKAKKRGKLEKKISKKEAKMRKKGVFLEEAVSETTPEEEPVEVVVQPWVRKSVDTMPLVEMKIDIMAKRRERSGLHDLFEKKFGESLMTPDVYDEYQLSEAERARLEKMGIGVREASVPPISVAQEVTPVEGVAVQTEETVAAPEEDPAATAEPMEAEEAVSETVMKPIYYPFQLWLYSKYGKDKKMPINILILIPSLLLFILSLIPRIVIFAIMTIFKKIKERKTKKVASEA